MRRSRRCLFILSRWENSFRPPQRLIQPRGSGHMDAGDGGISMASQRDRPVWWLKNRRLIFSALRLRPNLPSRPQRPSLRFFVRNRRRKHCPRCAASSITLLLPLRRKRLRHLSSLGKKRTSRPSLGPYATALKSMGNPILCVRWSGLSARMMRLRVSAPRRQQTRRASLICRATCSRQIVETDQTGHPGQCAQARA